MPVGLAVVPHAAGFADKAIPEKYWHAGRAFPLEENRAAGRRRCASTGQGRARDDRAARLHARGFSRRPRVPGGARHREPPRARAGVSRSACSTRASASSCRRTTRCRSAAWRRSAPRASICSDRSCRSARRCGRGICARRPTGGGSSSIATRPAAPKPTGWCYPHVLRYRKHAEFGCHGLIPGTTFEELQRASTRRARPAAISASPRTTGKSIATLKQVLVRFLDYAAGFPDVQFVRRRARCSTTAGVMSARSTTMRMRAGIAAATKSCRGGVVSRADRSGSARCAIASTIRSTCSIWAAAPAATSGAFAT